MSGTPFERDFCLWCERSFVPRAGGKPQKFCRPSHRAAFHSAARRWAEAAVTGGRLAVADLRAGVGRNTDCTETQAQGNVNVSRTPEQTSIEPAGNSHRSHASEQAAAAWRSRMEGAARSSAGARSGGLRR
jgi:hypothetical protein